MNGSTRKHIIRNTFLALLTIGLIICCWFGYRLYQRQQSIAFVESFPGAQVLYDRKPIRLLPGGFYYDTGLMHLSLHTWGEEQGSLQLLGDLKSLDTLCLLSPENVTVTNLKYLAEIEPLQVLTLKGDDSFKGCFRIFQDSHIKIVSLSDHKLTLEEAEQLTQMPKIDMLILTNVFMQPAVTQHLKEANIPRLSYYLELGQDSGEESHVTEVMQFLQNYAPVDQIHWNDYRQIGLNFHAEIISSKKELAIMFDQYSLFAGKADQAWNAIDTSQLTHLTLNPFYMTVDNYSKGTTNDHPDADLSHWPTDKFQQVRSITLIGNSRLFDLKELHRFPNLDTLQINANKNPAFENLNTLTTLPYIKHLSISGTLKTYPVDEFLLQLEHLEELKCREGEITISLLAQLLQQPKLKIIECVPVTDDKLATDEQIMVELERLGTQHRWKARKFGPQCFTLERITSQPTH